MNLEDNNLGDKSVKAILEPLTFHFNIRILNLSKNRLTDNVKFYNLRLLNLLKKYWDLKILLYRNYIYIGILLKDKVCRRYFSL